MRVTKKYHVKQLMLILLSLIIVLSIISCIQINLQYQSYEEKVGKAINIIIEKLAQNYPEEEIINSIADLKETEIQKNILESYGIETKDLMEFLGIQKDIQQNKIMNIVFIVSSAIALLIVFTVFMLQKDKRIKNITKYLKDINCKRYHLKIEENEEDELSELQNELYKITVMLKEQAEISQKDKKELANFLSDISHQIKTPLTSIMIMVDILKENRNLTKEKSEEFILEISRQLDWMNWLIITLLKMSKLEAGTIKLKKEKIKVIELIEQVEQNLSISLELKEQKLEVRGQKEVTYLGDYKWSVEAITNIVKNCIEHSPNGKIIRNTI